MKVGFGPLFLLAFCRRNMGYEQAVAGQIRDLIKPVVTDLGFELYDVQFRREGHGWVLRLIIDSDKGIKLDDCATVSREVGHLLEVEDPIEQAYNLEVSSPGLDRPLRDAGEFQRFSGKKAKVTTREPIDGQHHFVGTIVSCTDDVLLLATDQDEVEVPMSLIKKARLVVEI